MSQPYTEDTAIGTAVIGAGCAGLSLCHHLASAGLPAAALIDPGKPRPDHIWGFWDDGGNDLALARPLSHAAWQQWAFIDDERRIVHHAKDHAYRALSSEKFEGALQAALPKAGTRSINAAVCTARPQPSGRSRLTLDDGQQLSAEMVIDSRAPTPPDGCLLQHFGGWYVHMDQPVFDAGTAILMDFRVSQENGIHFIYLLPFSATTALVESTVFSSAVLPPSWYDAQVAAYLTAQYPQATACFDRRESGVIPLAVLHQDQPFGTLLGLGAGALRASSGYAFSQIQRQASSLSGALTTGSNSPVKPGCSALETWMDQVFLAVLKNAPERAAEIFLRAAAALDGDQFAAFMRGHANWAVLLRLMRGLPIGLFLRAALSGGK